MENLTYLYKKKTDTKIIKKVAFVTLAVNIILSILKMTFGALYGNVSVLSDALHSVSDVGTTLLVLLAVFISKPEPDRKHNYGHERIEPVIVLFFSFVLLGVSVMLIYQGATGLINPKTIGINYYLIGVTALSILIKEGMYWYTIRYAKKTSSNILKADAWHHRSDGLSSVAVLAGLVSSVFIKTDLVQNIALILVALLILKAAVEICLSSINQLIDKAVDKKTEDEIKALILETDGVREIENFCSRLFGNAVYIDLIISVSPDISVTESHRIAENVNERLEQNANYPIKNCNVHVHPAGIS